MYLCHECWNKIPGNKEDLSVFLTSIDRCEFCGHFATHCLSLVCFAKDDLKKLAMFLNCSKKEKIHE